MHPQYSYFLVHFLSYGHAGACISHLWQVSQFHPDLLVSPGKFSVVASTEDIYEAEAAYAASAAAIEKLASQVSWIGITCQRYGAFLELCLLLES